MAASLEQVKALAAPTPKEIIQTRPGGGGKQLSYITSRDVMDRFDEAVGPENWQVEFREHLGRTICELSVRIEDGEFCTWVVKSDGAGDTDIEGDKGGQSDAFKRAAVMWGFARDLYPRPGLAVEKAKKAKAFDADRIYDYANGIVIAAGRDEAETPYVLCEAVHTLGGEVEEGSGEWEPGARALVEAGHKEALAKAIVKAAE